MMPAADHATRRQRTSAPAAALLASPVRSLYDGIGYVAVLLDRALAELTSGRASVVEMAPASTRAAAMANKARFAARVAAAQVRAPLDLVLYNHVGLARAQRWVPAPVRRPYAVFVHGMEIWDPSYAPARLPVLTSASLLIANSRFTASRVREVHPGVGAVASCPLALLEETVLRRDGDVDAALLAHVRPESALILGRMSSGERYKGHDQLLECWGEVRSRIPGAQLVVAGAGDDLDRLRRKANSLPACDDVLFCGRISEATKRELLRRVALFVMPSRGEGFGLVYLEAMRSGLPCLGSVHDAAVDVIVHGETGMLVDLDTPGALASALAALLGDEARRRAYGVAGRRRFEEQFTFPHFRDRLGATLREAGLLPAGERP